MRNMMMVVTERLYEEYKDTETKNAEGGSHIIMRREHKENNQLNKLKVLT